MRLLAIFIAVTAALFPIAGATPDGMGDWYVDESRAEAGVAIGPSDVAGLEVRVEPHAVVFEITTHRHLALDPSLLDILYRIEFDGDWLEFGAISLEVRDGRLIRATIAVFDDDGGFTIFDIPATFDTADLTLTIDLPNGNLRGPMEHAFLKTEWFPCVVVICGGPLAPVGTDRVPNAGYLPAITPESA